MASTVVATLAGVSSKTTTNTIDLSPSAQKRVATYIANGSDITTAAKFYVTFIERNPGLCVQELITKIDPKATKNQRQAHLVRINQMLLRTREGRRLTTSGLVARAPVGQPYWHLFMQRIIGFNETAQMVPVRSPAVQKPKLAFGKDIGAELRDNTRANVADWCEVAGVGRRWLSQASVQAVQKNARGAVTQVTRENNLAIALSHAISTTTGPMIATMVRDIMATTQTPTARAAA